ncbi:MAG TPA: NAD-dependent epimerase/dehydratase family protein [Thermoanaerobaculia bacterium]|nr:NAD-dependent epimerase/dehydratase family protein [Thermoanaerobaculia bacterium]
MRILVTGGAGFIGSHLAAQLLGAGHEVAVLDDLSSGRRENVPTGARLHLASVVSAAAAGIVAAERPHAIFHLAAQVDAARSVREPLFDAEVNVLGTVRLLAAAAEAGVSRFVLASSAAVYGEPDGLPVEEFHPQRPLSPYGIAKSAAERYLEFFAREHGVAGVALRFANVYGPRQTAAGEAGVVAVFCHHLLAGEAISVHGDGRQTRDFVHVDDVVEASLLALAAPPGSYNVATGVETDVLAVAEALRRAIDPQARLVHAASRPGDPRRSVLSPDLAAARLGFRACVHLDDGLARTAGWFRSHLEGKLT